MNRLLTPIPTAAAVLLAAALAPAPLRAQESPEDKQKAEETVAYMEWYSANSSGDTAKALAAAKEYMSRYPQGENAPYVRKWLTGYQWTQFNEAAKKKDMNEVVRIARENQGDDASFAYWAAWSLRQNELLGAGEAAHARDAAEFTRAALAFVEKGGVATGIDASKFDKDTHLAWLHQNLALLASKDGKPEEALQHYETSSKFAAKDPAVMARNQLGCGGIHKDLYDAAVARFKALPEAERGATPSPAAQAAIDTANTHADAAIQCWAGFLGTGTGSPELRARIETAVGALWSYRHPDQPEGWKALVPKSGA